MIINRVKQLRDYFKISQQQLADKLLISKASISLVETNKRILSPRILRSISEIYGVNEQWLLGNSDEMFLEESKNLILLTKILKKLDTNDPLLLSIIEKLLILDIEEIKTLLPIIEMYIQKKS